MEANRNLKYVVRKGQSLEGLDIQEQKRRNRLQNLASSVDRFLFQKPAQTLGILILLIAVPIALYIAISRDLSVVPIQDDFIRVRTSNPMHITPNKEHSGSIQVESKDAQKIQFKELSIPDWVEGKKWANTEIDSILGSTYSYSGTPVEDISNPFSVLIQTEKEGESSCNGCDTEEKYTYALVAQTLTTRNCEETSAIWARNPVGRLESEKLSSHCQKFDTSCLVPPSWEKYEQEEACQDANTAPQFIGESEDVTISLDVDCNGEYISTSKSIEIETSAIDPDGDIVRFSVESFDDFIRISQDSFETIIRDIDAQNTKYSDYEYSARLKGSIDSSFANLSTPVTITACDVLSNCSSQSLQVTIVEKDICEFVLPETGNTAFELIHPEPEQVLSGFQDIVWGASGVSGYDVTLQILDEGCENFRIHTKSFANLKRNGNMGYLYQWDTREIDNGEYCLEALMRPTVGDPYWTHSQRVPISIQNDLSQIEDFQLEETFLAVGQKYSLSLPDTALITYKVHALPTWLTIDQGIISGVGETPGGYSYVIEAIYPDGNSVRDIVVVNVSSVIDNPFSGNIAFPTGSSVLGGDAEVAWNITDEDNVSLFELYYSSSGKDWKLIGSYPGSKSSASWDVSSLTNGRYFLKLDITDKTDNTLVTVSEPFYIANVDVEDSSVPMPRLYNIFPDRDAIHAGDVTRVSADFALPSKSGSISNYQLKLNDQDQSELCDIEENTIVCTHNTSLAVGRHHTQLSLTDSGGKTSYVDWFFEIQENPYQESTTPEILPETGAINTESRIIASIIIVFISTVFTGALVALAYGWRKMQKPPKPRVVVPAHIQAGTIQAPPPFVY